MWEEDPLGKKKNTTDLVPSDEKCPFKFGLFGVSTFTAHCIALDSSKTTSFAIGCTGLSIVKNALSDRKFQAIVVKRSFRCFVRDGGNANGVPTIFFHMIGKYGEK
jgi:hypothetical protein